MNKDIFIKVINNKVIFNLIFSNIHNIHKDIIKPDNLYKWFEILNKPQLLAYYNYEKEFKQYYSNNKFYSPRNGLKTHQYVLYNLISTNNLQLLKYLLEDLNVDNQYLRKIKSSNSREDDSGDLLFLALVLNKSEIVNYLTTSIINKKIEWNYKKAIKVIHNLNDIEFFKHVINNKLGFENINKNDLKSILEESSFHDRLDIINYLLENTKIMSKFNDDEYNELHKKMVKKAVQGGHLELLELFYQRGYLETCKEENLLNDALMNNHLHLLDWLNGKDIRFYDDNKYCTIHCGNLELVKWMSKNRPDGFTKKSMSYAALKGYMDIVQWLHANRTEGTCDDTIYQCFYSRNFDFEIMKWLLDNGIVSEILSSEDAENFDFDRLASRGSIELIDYMSKHGFNDRFTSDLMDTACRHGHLELVKWLHENRTEGCTFKAFIDASWEGRNEVLEWLIKNYNHIISKLEDMLPCTFMDNLAYSNCFDIMKLVDEPFSKKAVEYAARNSNLEMVKWLLGKVGRVGNGYIVEDAVYFATSHGDLEMLQLFEKYGKDFDKSNAATIKCASNGHIDTLQWLLERDAIFASEIWISAAQNDQLETLIWLNDNITTSCSVSILAKIDNPTIINWFKENRPEFQKSKKKK